MNACGKFTSANAGSFAVRKLLDTQLNSVDTHLEVGDVLAYDVTLGIAATAQTHQQLPYHKQQA